MLPADASAPCGPYTPNVSDLPPAVIEWVVGSVERGVRVQHVRVFPRASSSAVHGVDVERSDGRVERVVLRRYVYPEVLASEPAPVQRETLVLAALETTDVPAPRVIATDPDGAACGVPALLMTRLPGHSRWRPRSLDGFVDALAAEVPRIHATPLPTGDDFPAYHCYHAGNEPSPPEWSRHPEAWVAAIEAHRAGPPPFEPTFIHRDYHSGNVVWRGSTITGIVDWAWACRGPALVDVAHCRLNLVLAHGAEVADAYLDRWRELSGVRDYNRVWDLIDAVDALPDLDDSATAFRRLDDWVTRATR
jgi:aminoglycoside phosphotransferase (APT) family kinase protein